MFVKISVCWARYAGRCFLFSALHADCLTKWVRQFRLGMQSIGILSVQGFSVQGGYLCKLHIEVCDLSRDCPQEERYELGSQVR